MARKADTPCAGCGKLTWRGSGSLIPGLAKCRPCRLADPTPAELATRTYALACSECGARMRKTTTSAKQGLAVCRPCRAAKAVRVQCVACNELVRRNDSYYCSKTCAARHRAKANNTAGLMRPAPSRGPATRVFITDCMVCTRTFVSVYTASTCSIACKEAKRRDDQSNKTHRRRARERNAYVSRVSPREIHERDKWRCHICRKLVRKTVAVPHPRAATIDHLVPLAAGGTHEPANVATACFRCNCLKGDRGGGEQLMLVG